VPAPTLHTKDLVLKPLIKPLPIQPIWLNEPKNTQFSEQRWRKHTVSSCSKYILDCTYFWVINAVEIDKYIGTISVHLDEPNRVAEIGILIDHTYGGKGYGTQAWSEVQRWLLESGVRKVTAGCMSVNTPMVKIFKKTGMTFECERKGHFLKDGHPVNAVYYVRWK